MFIVEIQETLEKVMNKCYIMFTVVYYDYNYKVFWISSEFKEIKFKYYNNEYWFRKINKKIKNKAYIK